jgi:hypothetical protein
MNSTMVSIEVLDSEQFLAEGNALKHAGGQRCVWLSVYPEAAHIGLPSDGGRTISRAVRE